MLRVGIGNPSLNHSMYGSLARLKNFRLVTFASATLFCILYLFDLDIDFRRRNDKSRSSPVSNGIRCSSAYNSTQFAKASRSLNGEEAFLHENYFKGICNGTYVELGAHDGLGQDNTLAFHTLLGWSGLLIEPSPARFKTLQANRPGDLLINKAVCNNPGNVHFIDTPFVGGVWELMNAEFISRWHPTVDVNSLPIIPCSSFGQIVSSTDVFFDFLSLDVEGGEYEVLQTIGNIEFGVILVESDGSNAKKDYAVRSFLESKNYMFDGNHRNSQWFVHKRWYQIYRNVIY
jgi:FkbM family methyltransferase